MAEGKFISYPRVSTDKQGRSGLGIEAQREAVVRYLNGGQWTLSAEYVETESGRRSDRPKLAAALSHAKAIGAKLVFAKLDRLTRNVDLLRSLVASGVDLVFCDLPSVPAGPMGRFLLTQMAAVAELEAGLIGERTKNALARRKEADCSHRAAPPAGHQAPTQPQWCPSAQRQTGRQRGSRGQTQSYRRSAGKGPEGHRG